MTDERTFKLLWVEDDYITISGVMLPLRKKGWEVTACADFLSARKRIESKERFDFFLIDLILPFTVEGDDDNVGGDRDGHRHESYLGASLIKLIRAKYGDAKPIGVFSVVFDPAIEQQLRQFNVAVRFTKGTASNAEICSTIEGSSKQQSNQ